MGEAQVLTHADGTAHRIGAMLREAAEPERIRDAVHRLSVILLSSIRSAARRPVVPVVALWPDMAVGDDLRLVGSASTPATRRSAWPARAITGPARPPRSWCWCG
jgi:hypothetical protein